jgi:SAM-dependent methyltransferase
MPRVTSRRRPVSSGADEIERRRQAWLKNAALRSAYAHAWRELAAFAAPGPSLEIGCGGGPEGVLPRCWKSDVVSLPWGDLVADAMRLPFRDGALANIVGTDVLHHLPQPLEFLREAARALRSDGRLLLVEPCMSWVSYPLYRCLHREPADLRGDITRDNGGNQAAATLLFVRRRDVLAEQVPQLEILRCQPRDALVYPLSGGYSHPALLPARLERCAWWVEARLRPVMRLIAFRLAVALRRKEQA